MSGLWKSRHIAWLLACVGTVTLCSCRLPNVIDPPVTESISDMPNSRHVSNWDRNHGGQGPAREAYTSQPQPAAPLPPPPPPMALPIPFSPATSHLIVQAAHNAPTLPESAYTGNPYDRLPNAAQPGGCQSCGGVPGACGMPGSHCGGSWSPPGIACPWPADEYICDGGDKDVGVNVLRDWTVR
ncbi:MAG TPA: hypothetical protein VL096_08135, partial [Pirellulaceae bacterium]|nr:hypothetical protein [Pirellulaceae bacterium]